jgi:hypothetical protein
MPKSNHSSTEKEDEDVAPIPPTDTEVGTLRDILSSDDELLNTIGYRQVRGRPHIDSSVEQN